MTIEDSLNAFEQALDRQFNSMNIQEKNDNSFILPTPCTSSDESENENEEEMAIESEPKELVVTPPKSPQLNPPKIPAIAPRNLSVPKIPSSYYLDGFALWFLRRKLVTKRRSSTRFAPGKHAQKSTSR